MPVFSNAHKSDVDHLDDLCLAETHREILAFAQVADKVSFEPSKP